MAAAFQGNLEAVKVLLTFGADVGARDGDGRRALEAGGERRPKRKAAPARRRISRKELARYERGPLLEHLVCRWKDEKLEAVLADVARHCETRAVDERDRLGGYSLHLPSEMTPEQLVDVQRSFLAQGVFVFGLGSERKRLAVLPTTDKYEAIAVVGTAGPNNDVANSDVLSWLMELEREQPFDILQIGYDMVEGRFRSAIGDPQDLAKRMYRFCPDIVDQGFGSVAALAEALAKKSTLYLWWD
jgi:hypothetical protein